MNELERLEAMLRARPASLTIEQRRAASDALGDLFPLGADVRVEQAVAQGVPAEWTSTPAASTSEVILYLHFGGYVWGSRKSHRHLVSELAAKRNASRIAGFRRPQRHRAAHDLRGVRGNLAG